MFTVIKQEPLFQLVSASLVIDETTKIHNQISILSAFVSTVSFINSSIYNISFGETCIQGVSSQLSFEDMNITNLTNQGDTDFILVILDSTLKIINLMYSNSNSILFRSRTSSLEISTIGFSNIVGATQLTFIQN